MRTPPPRSAFALEKVQFAREMEPPVLKIPPPPPAMASQSVNSEFSTCSLPAPTAIHPPSRVLLALAAWHLVMVTTEVSVRLMSPARVSAWKEESELSASSMPDGVSPAKWANPPDPPAAMPRKLLRVMRNWAPEVKKAPPCTVAVAPSIIRPSATMYGMRAEPAVGMSEANPPLLADMASVTATVARETDAPSIMLKTPPLSPAEVELMFVPRMSKTTVSAADTSPPCPPADDARILQSCTDAMALPRRYKKPPCTWESHCSKSMPRMMRRVVAASLPVTGSTDTNPPLPNVDMCWTFPLVMVSTESPLIEANPPFPVVAR
eukprot:Opistho-2@56218